MRTIIRVDGNEYPLADEIDPLDIVDRVQAIARTGPGFLTLSTPYGFQAILITARSSVMIHQHLHDESTIEPQPMHTMEDWEL
ncbi:hypothetical protein [Microbacterium sp. NPDC055599]